MSTARTRQLCDLRGLAWILAVVVAAWNLAPPLLAQQITTTTPFQNPNSSYQEHFGVSGGLNGPNFHLGWGPNYRPPGGMGGAALPHGMSGNNVLQGGTTFSIGGGSGFLNFSTGQSSQQSNSTQAPSVTTMNGYGGSFSTGTLQPFVIGTSPIVGAGPGMGASLPDVGATVPWQQQLGGGIPVQPSPSFRNPGFVLQAPAMGPGLTPNARAQPPAMGAAPPAGLPPVGVPVAPAALPNRAAIQGQDVLSPTGSSAPALGNSSDPLNRLQAGARQAGAEAVPGVDEILSQRAAALKSQQDLVLENIRFGEEAERIGKPGVAKIYYQTALRYASESQQADLQARLKRLEASSAKQPAPKP